MTPEQEILQKYVLKFSDDHMLDSVFHGYVFAAMKEYGDQRFIEGRDKALDTLSEKFGTSVHKLNEILYFKTHPDLQP